MSDRARWGVVGLGRAGQARIRAIDARPHLELAGTAGRRPGRGTTTFEALCADPTVDGIVVCTENAHHAEAARRILDAGKHAIVEFPLAHGAAEAAELLERARRVGRVLHTELFGLITARHRATRDAWRGRPLALVESHFTGRAYRWVAAEARAGRVGQLAIARLHALTDLLGPLALDDARCAFDADGGYHLVARLTAPLGVRVVLDEHRRADLARGGAFTARLADGRALEPPPVGRPDDLFGRDFDVALRRIAGDAAAYVDDEAVVAVLALAEEISRAVNLGENKAP